MLIGNVLGLCICQVWSLYFHTVFFGYPWISFADVEDFLEETLSFWSPFLCVVGSETDFSSSSSTGSYKTRETLPSNSAGKISSSRRYGLCFILCICSLIQDGWYLFIFDLIFLARDITVLHVESNKKKTYYVFYNMFKTVCIKQCNIVVTWSYYMHAKFSKWRTVIQKFTKHHADNGSSSSMHSERMSCMVVFYSKYSLRVLPIMTLSCPVCLLLSPSAVGLTSGACLYSSLQEAPPPLVTQSFMPHTGRPPKPLPSPTAVATQALPEGMDQGQKQTNRQTDRRLRTRTWSWEHSNRQYVLCRAQAPYR